MVIDERMIGAPVIDRDGHQIGTVKEIQGNAFKVDVPLAFDYWMHYDGVRSASIDGIVMLVDVDHLHEFKLDSPEDAIPNGGRTDFDRFDEGDRHDVEGGSDSYGAHDRPMVGEVVTGQPLEDIVIVRSAMRSRDTYSTPDNNWVGVETDDVPVTGVTDWGDVSTRFRKDWQSEHETGGSWEEFEPGYHFGYEMAHDPRFGGRRWDEIEADLRTEWISWSGRSGAMSDESSWDRVRMSVRHAWDAALGHERAA